MVLPLIPILVVAAIAAASAGAGTVAVANAESAKANTETVKAGGNPSGSSIFDIFGLGLGSNNMQMTGLIPLVPLVLLGVGGLVLIKSMGGK